MVELILCFGLILMQINKLFIDQIQKRNLHHMPPKKKVRSETGNQSLLNDNCSNDNNKELENGKEFIPVNMRKSFKFTFTTQDKKILIQALDINSGLQYFGEITENLFIRLQDLEENIQNEEYQTIFLSENLMKLKIGAIQITLQSISKQNQQITQLKNTFKEFLQNQKNLVSLIQSLKDEMEKMKSKIQKYQKKASKPCHHSQIINTKWCQTLKGENLKILGNHLLSNKLQNAQFGLLQMGFTLDIKEKKSWEIVLRQNYFWIGIGICLKNSIKEKKFRITNEEASKTGHGCYLIHSNGVALSHTSNQFNNVQKDFKFFTGDVIYCEYDPIDWVIRCKRNMYNGSFEMPIIPPPADDAYHPCVRLYKDYSQVEYITQN